MKKPERAVQIGSKFGTAAIITNPEAGFCTIPDRKNLYKTGQTF